MKPFEIDDIHATALANIEAEITDAIDDYNAAVADGNDELAQMIHLSIQGLQRRKRFVMIPPSKP
jgi:Holliday junction resolvasome RuvABC ATP-dependent DNA helicase subunit